nr:ATP-grasp domain-containing protein [Xanthomonadaceae bacterium]
VLDVGTLTDGRWACVEQNAAWGAGIYGCDPERVLAVVRAACHKRAH